MSNDKLPMIPVSYDALLEMPDSNNNRYNIIMPCGGSAGSSDKLYVRRPSWAGLAAVTCHDAVQSRQCWQLRQQLHVTVYSGAAEAGGGDNN